MQHLRYDGCVKPRRSAISCGPCVVACVVLGSCFEDPPPIEQGTSEGSTAGETLGMTTEPPTSTGTSGGGATMSTSEPGSTGVGEASGATETVGLDSSTGPAVVCGDGVVDDGEMCDTTPGCDALCRFTDYACNPLNNAGCEAPERCGLFDFPSESFACMPSGPAGEGGACGLSKSNDGDCNADLTCIFHTKTVLCAEGNCCVSFCDALAGTGCADFEICAQFFPMPMHQGLEHLGFCFSR
jgi:hypothetical protein